MHYILGLGLLIWIGPSASARDIALLVHSYPPSSHAKFSFGIHRRRFARALRQRPDLTPMAVRAYARVELDRKIARLGLTASDRITHLMFTGDGRRRKVGGLDFDDPETAAALRRLARYLAPDATVAFVACQFLPNDVEDASRDVEDLAKDLSLTSGRILALHDRLIDPFAASLLQPPWRVPMTPEGVATGVEQSLIALSGVVFVLLANQSAIENGFVFAGVTGSYLALRQGPRLLDRRKLKAFRFELHDGRVVGSDRLTFGALKRDFVGDSCERSLSLLPQRQ